ncbi:hypothetical protein F485_gp191 [Aeromonas phage CC2]|uniref:Uncharacterized protein n=1 Tax=Aeromonas phage CC2 TaxID=1204516 RepID=I6XL33_9CAUD|nr:hypothetical protein F485_gp191 [Aeromonas phage CC2]AFN39219.1 hypothetical protein CC2_104 [Aeromonas phage CC2]
MVIALGFVAGVCFVKSVQATRAAYQRAFTTGYIVAGLSSLSLLAMS